MLHLQLGLKISKMQDSTPLSRKVLEELGYVYSCIEDVPTFKKQGERTIQGWASYFTLFRDERELKTVGDLKEILATINN